MSDAGTSAPINANENVASPQQPPRRRLRQIIKIAAYLFVALLLVCVGVVFVGHLAFDYVTRPGIAGPEVTVEIPEGATGRQAAKILADNGLVEHELFVRIAYKIDKRPVDIKFGTYTLAKGLSPMQLLEKLREGPESTPKVVPDELKVTVPEGLSVTQAAKLFENPDAFVEASMDPLLISDLGIDVPSLEGFLMPNTYFFEKKPTEREVVERMLKQFKQEWAKITQDIPEAANQDMLEIVTIASLVEEEARVDAERPLVAAVVYNRLNERMLLGMDSTLQFALNKYGQRLLDKDKAVDSPYNTYVHVGLPPGPICSPGVKSIRAALQPADEAYLYFVSNADGTTHTFSKTIEEHNKAVAKYRREIAVQRREQRQRQQQAEAEAETEPAW